MIKHFIPYLLYLLLAVSSIYSTATYDKDIVAILEAAEPLAYAIGGYLDTDLTDEQNEQRKKEFEEILAPYAETLKAADKIIRDAWNENPDDQTLNEVSGFFSIMAGIADGTIGDTIDDKDSKKYTKSCSRTGKRKKTTRHPTRALVKVTKIVVRTAATFEVSDKLKEVAERIRGKSRNRPSGRAAATSDVAEKGARKSISKTIAAKLRKLFS